jgi:enterochelin esterase-like enzyme
MTFRNRLPFVVRLVLPAALLASPLPALAADGAACKPGTRPAAEVLEDLHVSFRLCAPDAHAVAVALPDVGDVAPVELAPLVPAVLPLTRDASGLWSATTPWPLPPDTYRYSFRVDGVSLPDPAGTTFVELKAGMASTFEVAGAAGDFQARKDGVPHGVVSVVEYPSKALGIVRRAHVYTPPGYMAGTKRYPVLYLVHGAAFNDDSWTSLGHAQYILDNLIAAGRAVPMIVVMPMGHTPPRPGADMMDNPDFGNDLSGDLIPWIDTHFRTEANADARAMAGFSMGGMLTIRSGLTRPDLFHSIGIFSMGLGMRGNMAQVGRFEQANDAALKQDAHALRLLYLAIGRQDPVYSTVAPTRAMFAKYGLHEVYHESAGGHTFINWRRYLADFAPRLFRGGQAPH